MGNRVYKSCVAWELGVIYQPRAWFLWMFLVAFSVAKFCVLLSSSQSIIISSSFEPFQGTHLPPINNPGRGWGNRALDEPAPALVPRERPQNFLGLNQGHQVQF